MKWLQLVLIGGLAPFFLFPSQDRVWIFLCVPVFLLAKGLVRKKIFERTALDWPMAVLAIQVLVSSLRTTDRHLSLPKIAGMGFAILAFYVIVDALISRKAIKAGIAVFIAGGLLFAIVGLLGMKVQDTYYQRSQLGLLLSVIEKIPKIEFNLAGAEEGFNSNAVGGTLTLFIPAVFVTMVYYWRKGKRRFNKIVFAALLSTFLFATGVLILAASRGSWAGTAISLAVAGWILFMLPKKRFLLLIPSIGAAVLVLIAGYLFLVKPGNIEAAKMELEKKYQGRIQAWTVGVETIKAHPLTGIGMNHVRVDPRIGYDRAHVHNHMLHTAAELGIPALAAYLAILMGAGWMCRDVIRKSRYGFERAAALGLGTGQLAHFLFGLGDSIPLGAKPGIVFWVSLGLIAALYNRTTRPGFSAGIHAGVPHAKSGTSLSPVSRAAISTSVALLALFLVAPAPARGEDLGPRKVLSRASVVSEPPSMRERMTADRLFSGRPERAWRSRKGDAPPFVFIFALSLDSRIDGLRFFNSRSEERLKGIGAKEVEVEFSMEGPDSGWRSAGVFLLEPGPAPQEFAIPRSRARWVRLTIRSNHGHRLYTELGEFEAWGNFIFDVPLLLSHALWIMGAALVLAAFSFHEHRARREGLRLREALGRSSFRGPAAAGAALGAAGIAAGIAGRAGGGLIAAVLAGAAAGGAALYFAARKRRPGTGSGSAGDPLPGRRGEDSFRAPDKTSSGESYDGR